MARLIFRVMNFLRNLRRLLGDGGPPDEAPSHIEILSIAIRRKNEMNYPRDLPPIVKSKVFMPRFNQQSFRLEASSFCLDGLSYDNKWSHLQQHCGADLPKPIVGRADFSSASCRSCEPPLTLNPDWKPDRHVNIIGWSDQEEVQLAQAQILRSHSKLILNAGAG